jgi:propionyl-CoA carboxylase alpha chain
MVHPRFVKGDLTTNFIADEFPNGFNPDLVVQQDPSIVIVVAAAVHQLHCERASLLSDQMAGHEAPAPKDWVVTIAKQQHAVQVELTDQGYWVKYAKKDYEVISDWCIGEPLFKGTINGVTVSIQVEPTTAGYRLIYRGAEITARVITPAAAALMSHMLYKSPADMSKFLLSPMPGLLVKLSVGVGQVVKEGEELAVVEAMKMENGLRAVQDGIVSNVSAVQGDSLAVDQIILEFE